MAALMHFGSEFNNNINKVENLEIKKLNIPKRKLNEFETTNLLSEFGINMNKCHLIKNKSELEFIFKNVFIKPANKKNLYFKNIDKDILEFHIAHNEGNYFCTNDQLKEIEDNNQVAIYYCNDNGKTEEKFNPNGSLKNIAGIFNKEKNVLGMMPHPERMIDKSLSGEDGSLFFKNLLNNIK